MSVDRDRRYPASDSFPAALERILRAHITRRGVLEVLWKVPTVTAASQLFSTSVNEEEYKDPNAQLIDDICTPQKTTSLASRAANGEKLPKNVYTVVSEGNAGAIRTMSITEKNIVVDTDQQKRMALDQTKGKKHTVLLVPVGYTDNEIAQEFPEMTSLFGEVLGDLPIEFAHLSTSADIGVRNVGVTASFTNPDEITALRIKVQQFYDANTVAVIVNTPSYFGTVGPYDWKSKRYPYIWDKYAIFNGRNEYFLYLFAHEIVGHKVGGLTDGYLNNNYYNRRYFSGSEFAVYPYDVTQEVYDARVKVKPKIVQTPFNCKGYPVFRFMPDDTNNIMVVRKNNAAILEQVKNGMPLFNDFQRQIILNKIKNGVTFSK